MNWFYNTVALLKKHGYTWQARFDIFCIVAFIACLIIDGNIVFAYAAVVFFLFLIWEVDDARNKEKLDECRQQLADKEDEVVLLKGENAKLQEELESLKASAEARKSQAPRKRPPFKKKPKTENPENENKD